LSSLATRVEVHRESSESRHVTITPRWNLVRMDFHMLDFLEAAASRLFTGAI